MSLLHHCLAQSPASHVYCGIQTTNRTVICGKYTIIIKNYIIEIYGKYQCNKVKLNTNSYWLGYLLGYLVVYVHQHCNVSWLSGETDFGRKSRVIVRLILRAGKGEG